MRFGEEDNRGHTHFITSYLEYIPSTYHCCHWPWAHGWGDVDYIFPPGRPLFPILPTLCCLEGGPYAQPTVKEREVILHFLEGKGPHKLLGIHLHGIFVYSPFLLFLNVFYLSLKCWNNRTTPTCQWLNTRLISCPCHDIYHGSASGLFVLHSLSGTQALAGPPRGELRLLTHPAFPSCQGRRRALEGFAPAIKCFSLDVTQVNSTHSSATPGGQGI